MKTIKSDSYSNQEDSESSVPKNYFSVGHDWFDNRISKGCAYMWYLTTSGEFICEQESDDIPHHGKIKHNKSAYNMAYKGRVDVCFKQASITTCEGCLDERSRRTAEECEGLRRMAMDYIKQRFGKAIVIHSF